MALQVQRKRSVNLGRLITTAVVALAFVAQPMYGLVASQVANAAEPSHSVAVTTEAELLDAAADKTKTVIHIRSDIELDQKIQISDRNVNIKGHGHKLTFNGVDGWNGEYVIQAYKNYITVGSLSISGGDAAIYANGATVRILGTVDVSDNEFGGIELSRGVGVTGTPTLNLTEAGAALVNNTEKTGEPTVWVDKVSNPLKGAGSVINGGSFTKTTHIGDDQHQYYIDQTKANITAVNVTDSTTYDDVQDAVDAAKANDTIKLLKDAYVNKSVLITKALTFDGNGLSVVSSFTPGSTSPHSGVIQVQNVTSGTVKFVANNNKAFRVHGQGNAVIDGPGSYNGLHGINVYNSSVELNNVILNNNGKSGLNVGQDSKATVSNLSTKNNTWHGVDVDKGTAELTIGATSQHGETKLHNGLPVPHLYIDNVSVGTINDSNSQYVAVDNYSKSGDRAYFLKSATPAAPSIDGFTQNSADRTTVNVPSGSIVNTNGTSPNSTHMLWNNDDYDLSRIQAIRYAYQLPGAEAFKNGAVVKQSEQPQNFNTAWVGGIFSKHGQGEYKFKLQVQGLNGLWSDWSEPASLTYDSTAPKVEIVDYDDDMEGEAALYGVVDDPNASVVVNIDGTDYNADVYTETVDGESVTVWVLVFDEPLSPNTYSITVRAKDQAGNETPEADWARNTLVIEGESTAPVDNGGRLEPEQAAENDLEQQDEVELPGLRGANAPAFAFANANVFTLPGETDGDQSANAEILGAQTERNTDSSNQFAAAVPTADGWKIFGLMWYWWLVIAAAIAGAWWAIAAARRRKEDQAI